MVENENQETETVEEETPVIEVESDGEAVEPEKDLTAEVEKWKALSRKNEKRAETNAAAAKELEELRKASMTDQERIVEDTRRAVRTEYAAKLVEAEFRSQLTGKTLDADAILSFNKNDFVDENGDVDSEAIATWVDAHIKTPEIMPDLGQGVRSKTLTGKSQIRSRDDLRNMTPEEILVARKEGRLDSLMGKL
jgi:hypothetical protein